MSSQYSSTTSGLLAAVLALDGYLLVVGRRDVATWTCPVCSKKERRNEYRRVSRCYCGRPFDPVADDVHTEGPSILILDRGGAYKSLKCDICLGKKKDKTDTRHVFCGNLYPAEFKARGCPRCKVKRADWPKEAWTCPGRPETSGRKAIRCSRLVPKEEQKCPWCGELKRTEAHKLKRRSPDIWFEKSLAMVIMATQFEVSAIIDDALTQYLDQNPDANARAVRAHVAAVGPAVAEFIDAIKEGPLKRAAGYNPLIIKVLWRISKSILFPPEISHKDCRKLLAGDHSPEVFCRLLGDLEVPGAPPAGARLDSCGLSDIGDVSADTAETQLITREDHAEWIKWRDVLLKTAQHVFSDHGLNMHLLTGAPTKASGKRTTAAGETR